MLNSLRLRLTIGALVAIGLSLFMVWQALSRLFTDYVANQYHQEMQVISDSLAANLAFPDGVVRLEREPADPRFSLPAGGRYWQIDIAGQKSLRSRSLWDSEFSRADMRSSTFPDFLEAGGPDGKPVLVHVQTTAFDDTAQPVEVTIHTAFERAEIDQALVSFHDDMRLMLGLTALLLMLAALIQGAVGLAPLVRLKAAVASIRSGGSRTLAETVPTEVMPLVKEINLLIEERETALERARARASDLAHGLKTPLTVLSNLAERLPASERDTALKQVELIRQRSDRQLQAARMGVEQMATTEVAVLVGKLVQVFRPMTDQRDITWQVDIPDAMTIGIDPADLAEATGNVIDNAAKWTRTLIRIDARADAGSILLSVSDDGPGIAEGDVDAVLRRGHTSDAANGGSGLGLAISRDITEAYGGSVTIGRSALGGADVTLSFPEKPLRQKAAVPH